MRSWIARGEVPAVAECHPDQLGAIERADPHLLGAFQQMSLAERTDEQTLRVLERAYAESRGKPPGDRRETDALNDTAAALRRLQRMHLRYATYSANPGRPLRFLRNLLDDQFPDKGLTEDRVSRGFSRDDGDASDIARFFVRSFSTGWTRLCGSSRSSAKRWSSSRARNSQTWPPGKGWRLRACG